MKIMQKGQSMVEFAVIFPIFLFLIFFVTYFSMAFADYLELSNMARSSAREAALVYVDSYDSVAKRERTEKEKDVLRQSKYNDIRNKYDKKKLISDVHQIKKYNIKYDNKNENVIVDISAPLNKASTVGKTMNSLLNVFAKNKNDEQGAFDINIKYTMYSENTSKK